MEASNAANAAPDDPTLLLESAEATLDYFGRFQQGDLSAAIAAAREAGKLDENSAEPLYWEAACQDAAQHIGKAIQTYERFIEQSQNHKP